MSNLNNSNNGKNRLTKDTTNFILNYMSVIQSCECTIICLLILHLRGVSRILFKHIKIYNAMKNLFKVSIKVKCRLYRIENC